MGFCLRAGPTPEEGVHNCVIARGMVHPIVRVSDGTTCFQEPFSYPFVCSWANEVEMLKWLTFHDQPKPAVATPGYQYHNSSLKAARTAVLAHMGNV